MSQIFISLLFIIFLTSSCFAWETVSRVTEVRTIPDGVELHAGRVAVRISAWSDSVVRVRYAKNGIFPDKVSFAVLADTGFVPPRVQVTNDAQTVQLATGKFSVRIEKSPLRVIFEETSGKIILQDHPSYPPAWNRGRIPRLEIDARRGALLRPG